MSFTFIRTRWMSGASWKRPQGNNSRKSWRSACRNPTSRASRLSGRRNRYKIKLRSAGYRLVYEVRDENLIVLVIAVGKRERNVVYDTAAKR